MTKLTFDQVKEGHLKTLGQYVPVVARVHGGNHPEFHNVRHVFDSIMKKTKEVGNGKPELNEEFKQLRELTHHYTIPEDVCETYAAVYEMLAEIDEIYHMNE